MFLFDLSEFGGLVSCDVWDGLVDEPHELNSLLLERRKTRTYLVKQILVFF